MQIRPSVKLILAAYGACGLVEGLIVAFWLVRNPHPSPAFFLLMIFPAIGQFMAAKNHAAKLSTQLNVAEGRIRYETGMMTRSTRTLELAKIQDVRVDQTPLQRMLDLGDLSLETAGETGRLVIPAIDHPHQIADQLLNMARRA